MAWTAPRTWVAGEIVTAALGNTHWRDNLRYLKGTDGAISLDHALLLPAGAGYYFRLPVLTTAQRDALSPAAGWEVWNSTTGHVEHYDGTAWQQVKRASDVVVQAAASVFNGTAPTSWTDLDLSGTVGINRAVVMLRVENNGGAGAKFYSFRANGDTKSASGSGLTYPSVSDGGQEYILVPTDASGIIEWNNVSGGSISTQLFLVAYWRTK